MLRSVYRTACFLACLSAATGLSVAESTPANAEATPVQVSQQTCDLLSETGFVTLPAGWTIETDGNRETRAKHNASGVTLSLRVLGRADSFRGLRFAFSNAEAQPTVSLTLDNACAITAAQRIDYDPSGKPVAITSLEGDGQTVAMQELLNPPVPAVDPPTGPVIALIDTGVNYTLPELTGRIARSDSETLLGWDFWDNDAYPYDMDPRRSPYFPRRHGTTVFSVLAREAPNAAIAVYRFPALDLCRFADLIADLREKSIRLASLSMGSNRLEDWQCFAEAAREADVLFIVSAGNNGRNIDDAPVYPAALDLENILVVTSVDLEGRLARESNFGPQHVDFLIPAERVEVIDHRGVRSDTGGTSYAVPRLAAMAARFLGNHPDADISAIKKALIARAIPAQPGTARFGWIPDPTDNYLLD